MKFKNVLSCSMSIIMYGAVLLNAGFSAHTTENADSDTVLEPVPTVATLPALKIKTDTMYMAAEKFYHHEKPFLGGVYQFKKGTVIMYHYIAETDDVNINKWCDVIRRINEITDSVSGKLAPIDFMQNEIANMVLMTGFDKYRTSVSNGMYMKRICDMYDKAELCDAYHNNMYKNHDVLLFNLENNEWGPMFSYETDAGRNVGTWNSASESVRQYVLNGVDSIIDATIGPGHHAQKPAYFCAEAIKCR